MHKYIWFAVEDLHIYIYTSLILYIYIYIVIYYWKWWKSFHKKRDLLFKYSSFLWKLLHHVFPTYIWWKSFHKKRDFTTSSTYIYNTHIHACIHTYIHTFIHIMNECICVHTYIYWLECLTLKLIKKDIYF